MQAVKLIRRTVVFGTVYVALLFFAKSNFFAYALGQKQHFSINLKTKALVIGPDITLGEIGQVIIPDRFKRSQLAAVKIAPAPPPGESTEISMTLIKRRMTRAGFGEFIPYLKGPRAIRVTTAQTEIDKAFIKEQYALTQSEETVKT